MPMMPHISAHRVAPELLRILRRCGIRAASDQGARSAVLAMMQRSRLWKQLRATKAVLPAGVSLLSAMALVLPYHVLFCDDEKKHLNPRQLQAAIAAADWSVCQDWVVEHGVDAHATRSERTLLSLAAEAGMITIVRALLAEGANPSTCDNQGLSVMMYAARKGHTPVIEALLEAKASPDGPADIFGNSPLHGAVGFAHVEATRALLDAGCDANQLTGKVTAPEDYQAKSWLEAPLHLAVRIKPPHLELRSRALILLLLDYGANVCIQDVLGDTAVHLLVRKGDAWALWTLLAWSAPELAELAATSLPNQQGRTAIAEAAASEASFDI
eukprot:CAMPEP_0178386978 /NCGR_PEP_ID=MMETSP0689_2-20121128/8840_1 /TAXON_ID=160604 /ORGANISM="Amphidinium massartii, Strain CS-259" /LENGTH=327 /DNA_ID=CAMNT_0020007335 /DNA_START=1 /DNA_END=981 /DNA_ORIENTATION=+